MRKVIVDLGYGLVKAGAEGKTVSIPSGVEHFSYKKELEDALNLKPELLGFQFGESYYAVGGYIPTKIREDRWNDPIETAILLGAGLRKLGIKKAEKLYMLAPVNYAKKKVSLLEALQPLHYIHQVKDENGRNVAKEIQEIEVLPQPQGLAYHYTEMLEEEGLAGVVVVDIGMGTTDIMSFIYDEDLQPEWDRPITHTYDLSGSVLEDMLSEAMGGKTKKIVRLRMKQGKAFFTEEQKRHIVKQLARFVEDWQQDKEDYLVVIGGGGAFILFSVFPEVADVLAEETGFNIVVNPDPMANVEGIMKAQGV